MPKTQHTVDGKQDWDFHKEGWMSHQRGAPLCPYPPDGPGSSTQRARTWWLKGWDDRADSVIDRMQRNGHT